MNKDYIIYSNFDGDAWWHDEIGWMDDIKRASYYEWDAAEELAVQLSDDMTIHVVDTTSGEVTVFMSGE